MQTLHLLQSTIEDVILLEYIWQIDYGEHIDSSTYIGLCHNNASSFITDEHKQVYVSDQDGDMFKDMVRNNPIPQKERTQPFISAFDEDQVWHLGASNNVHPGPTAHLHINIL
jgi:hypothetical protein